MSEELLVCANKKNIDKSLEFLNSIKNIKDIDQFYNHLWDFGSFLVGEPSDENLEEWGWKYSEIPDPIVFIDKEAHQKKEFCVSPEAATNLEKIINKTRHDACCVIWTGKKGESVPLLDFCVNWGTFFSFKTFQKGSKYLLDSIKKELLKKDIVFMTNFEELVALEKKYKDGNYPEEYLI